MCLMIAWCQCCSMAVAQNEMGWAPTHLRLRHRLIMLILHQKLRSYCASTNRHLYVWGGNWKTRVNNKEKQRGKHSKEACRVAGEHLTCHFGAKPSGSDLRVASFALPSWCMRGKPVTILISRGHSCLPANFTTAKKRILHAGEKKNAVRLWSQLQGLISPTLSPA